MFPTTIWDLVRAAGDGQPAALDALALDYRDPVLAFVRRRGIAGAEAEDLCQEVFVRLLAGGVIGKADVRKGRFRTLLCTVTIRVIQDWTRRQRTREVSAEGLDVATAAPDFDRLWVRHLLSRALAQLKATSPHAYDVIRSHLAGEKPDRNRLWIARRKLAALMRREIAITCRSPREVQEELAALSPYLRPQGRR